MIVNIKLLKSTTLILSPFVVSIYRDSVEIFASKVIQHTMQGEDLMYIC